MNPDAATGYAHASYAASLAEFGRPIYLPQSRGWLLERPVPGVSLRDAMGCYPIFSCSNWKGLSSDLETLSPELLSVVFVADPFSDFDVDDLSAACSHGTVPFKQHYVLDLACSPERAVCLHHRRNARKAGQLVEIDRIEHPEDSLNEWCGLYSNLVERHGIRGISAFSRQSFMEQMQTPGFVAFRAREGGVTVGMLLWYVQGEVGYYHLGAYSERGYELSASFALFWEAIAYFRKDLAWLNLGGGAGIANDEADGLNRFKMGWTTHTRTAFLCRHVVNAPRYDELCGQRGASTSYFPAYRAADVSPARRAA